MTKLLASNVCNTCTFSVDLTCTALTALGLAHWDLLERTVCVLKLHLLIAYVWANFICTSLWGVARRGNSISFPHLLRYLVQGLEVLLPTLAPYDQQGPHIKTLFCRNYLLLQKKIGLMTVSDSFHQFLEDSAYTDVRQVIVQNLHFSILHIRKENTASL